MVVWDVGVYGLGGREGEGDYRIIECRIAGGKKVKVSQKY